MSKKKEGISDDYRIEIEQALEEVVQRPVGSDSLEAKVIPAEIPDTVEQLLDYARHSANTEYSPEVQVYDTSTESESTDYWYHSDAAETTTDSSHSATYQFTVQENNMLKSADAQLASAALHNTFGVYDAFTHVTEDMQARIDNFKLLNKAEWYFMYEASAWLVTNI
ncbi:hypothetical protein KY338_01505 [Candidatus Woesearchaeota archaeon]|nr:hypothetical protein [Candidatus Woesearchaeota archaeon]MBW3005590.1 hypothetical protein [Candidatus Woesearchaeota archaeon]